MSFSKIGSLLVSILLASLVIGQILRFPLPGQGGGLLISDLAVVLVLLAAAIWSFSHWDLIGHWTFVIGILSFPFILWSLFTLIIRVPALGHTSSAIAFAYWLRLTSQLLLLPALLVLFCPPRRVPPIASASAERRGATITTARRGLLTITIILILLGFLQLWLIPDFSSLTKLGWDPHQSRLTSTWLDPNFFGAFLVIILPFVVISLASALPRRPLFGSFSAAPAAASEGLRLFAPPTAETKPKRLHNPLTGRPRAALALLLLIIITIVALLLTQSRSALLALVLSTLIFSPFLVAKALRHATHARIIATLSSVLLILLLFTSAGFLLGDRLIGVVTLDATAQLRLDAFKEAWHLAEQHSILGVGAGAYQFTAQKAGLISGFAIHSRAGADNSLLTLWITTGLVGVILFFLPWAFIIWRTRSLVILFSFTALFIHSQFINSFLYSHLLITLIVITALTLTAENKSKFQNSNVK